MTPGQTPKRLRGRPPVPGETLEEHSVQINAMTLEELKAEIELLTKDGATSTTRWWLAMHRYMHLSEGQEPDHQPHA